LPEQIAGLETLEIATVGDVFTVMVVEIVFVLAQLEALAPTIEYVVVPVGLTLKLVPVAPVFNNVYVEAPLGVIKLLLPEQITGLETLEIATVGVVLTVIVVVIVFVLAQLAILDPIIEYVVVELGLTLNEVPIIEPGYNVYVEAPLGVITLLFPEQITGLETLEIATVGDALTEIVVVIVLVLAQLEALAPTIE
jgi:hypothetical protein